jgi:two-component system chemotaxis response regulator CheY
MDKLSSLSFLIIDDNRHMLTIVRVLLHAFGVKTVHECEDASAGFEKFRAVAPDIVIVDYQMSPMNGIDFVRMARRSKDSPNCYVPIILLTAHSKRQSVVEARDAGVTEILVKPVTAKDLLARIQTIIYNPRPFIDVPTYFGPCRRRKQDLAYHGIERRKRAPDPAAELKLAESEA